MNLGKEIFGNHFQQAMNNYLQRNKKLDKKLVNALTDKKDQTPDFRKIPSIIGIAAIAANGVIGDSNDYSIPWRRTPEDKKLYKWDMDFFKRETEFCPVIMGFKTMYSLKKPLKNRYNIVINTHKNDPLVLPPEIMKYVKETKGLDLGSDIFETIEIYSENNKFVLVNSLEFALTLVLNMATKYKYEIEKAFVIGGAKTFKEAIEKDYLSNIYLTSLDESYEGDIYFPTKSVLKKYSEYSHSDYGNGDIRQYEIVDPEYKKKLIENIAINSFKDLREDIEKMYN